MKTALMNDVKKFTLYATEGFWVAVKFIVVSAIPGICLIGLGFAVVGTLLVVGMYPHIVIPSALAVFACLYAAERTVNESRRNGVRETDDA